MKHFYFVSTIVLRPSAEGYQVLMGKRTPGEYLGGTWQLITGAIEPGETAWQAVLREVREEACLEVRQLWRLPRLTQFYAPAMEALCFAPMFAAMVAEDAVEVCNSEHTELAWLSFADAHARMMWPTDRAALAEVQELILSKSPAEEQLRIPLDPPTPGSVR